MMLTCSPRITCVPNRGGRSERDTDQLRFLAPLLLSHSGSQPDVLCLAVFFLTGLPVGPGPRSLVGAGSPVGPVSAAVTEKFLYIKLSVTCDIFSFLRRRHSWLATNLKHPRKYARALSSGTRIVTRQRSRLTRVALHRGAPNVNDY